MSRPEPIVHLYRETSPGLRREIVSGEGFWFITYKGLPVNVRDEHWNSTGRRFKYRRTGFANRAHALRLAERLNQEFATEDFGIRGQ